MVSSDDIVRSDSKVEDVQIENADIISKFKFFETYKPSEKEKKKFRITPPREGVTKVSAKSQQQFHLLLILIIVSYLHRILMYTETHTLHVQMWGPSKMKFWN